MLLNIYFILFFSEQDSELNYQKTPRKSKPIYNPENPRK